MAEEKQEQEGRMQHPPHLVNVYFGEEPEFDFEEMKAYLLDMDQGGPEDVEITSVEGQDKFIIKMDKINAQVMKAPELDKGIAEFIQKAEQFPEEFRENLANHKVLYQAVVTNVSEIGPFEAQISLLKIATALCDYDGICAAFPFSGIILPTEILDDANNTVFGGSEGCDCDDPEHEHEHEHCDHCEGEEGGEEYSLWDMMRMEGQPLNFLISLAGFKSDDVLWLVTRGMTFCGLPDVVVKVDKQEEADKMAQLLQNIFAFEVSQRKVFSVGDRVDFDENSYIEFSEPPQIQCPFPTFGVIRAELIQREQKPKIEIVRS